MLDIPGIRCESIHIYARRGGGSGDWESDCRKGPLPPQAVQGSSYYHEGRHPLPFDVQPATFPSFRDSDLCELFEKMGPEQDESIWVRIWTGRLLYFSRMF